MYAGSRPSICRVTKAVITVLSLLVVSGSSQTNEIADRTDTFCPEFSSKDQLNTWTAPATCSKSFLDVRTARYFAIGASYLRGFELPEWQRDNLWRMVLFGGVYKPNNTLGQTVLVNDTWTYCPTLNSWTLLQPEHVAHDRAYRATRPLVRRFHTMSTLCNTSVVLFGGQSYRGRVNDTWLFNGTTELWEELNVQLLSERKFVRPRSCHTSVVIRQPLSNCSCQESILIYGGVGDQEECFGDLWEIRCISDSYGKDQLNWIFVGDEEENSGIWPPLTSNHYASDFNRTLMYTWGGVNCINKDTYTKAPSGKPLISIWEFNLTSTTWYRYATEESSRWTSHLELELAECPPSPVYYHKLDGIVAVTRRSTLVLQSQNGSVVVKVIPSTVTNQDSVSDSKKVYSVHMVVFGEFLYSWKYSKAGLVPMWKLSRRTNCDVWEWLSVPYPLTAPSTIGIQATLNFVSFVGQSFLVIGDSSQVVDEVDELGVTVWQHDLVRQTWFFTWSTFGPRFSFCFGATFSTNYKSMLVVYLPDPQACLFESFVNNSVEVSSTSLWVFHASAVRRWSLCLTVSHQSDVPEPRYDSSMVDMGNGSLLWFGGQTLVGAYNELWRVDLCNQVTYMPMVENCVTWVLLSRNTFSATHPAARHSHGAFMSSGNLYVLGGTNQASLYSAFVNFLRRKGVRDLFGNTSISTVFSDKWKFNKEFYSALAKGTVEVSKNTSSSIIFSDMWKFNTNLRVWEEVEVTGMAPILPCAMAKLETKVVVVGNRTYPFDTCGQTVSNSTLAFDVASNEWMALTLSPPETLMNDTRLMAIAPYEDNIIVLRPYYFYGKKVLYAFSLLYPTCPLGRVSKRWSNETCTKCSKGSYASLGAARCSSCSNGLTTKRERPTSSEDCTCRDDFCDQGECNVIIAEEGTRSAVCHCKVGYTGTTCKYPTYYLIGAGMLAMMILIIALFLFIRRMMRYRKAKRHVEEELSSAHRVWTIHSDEIILGERIDGDTPGSYGEVYWGVYRDITVAIKYLNAIMFSDQRVRREFEREVEVMRAIRHPNIVMFFGAGKQVEMVEGREINSYPFLVVEFMARGTLKKILNSPEIPLSYKDRAGFALDAARGMQYLHALSPPRIHRDIKSCNLLVSKSWKVKVSDFGSARVVQREGERQQTNESRVQNQPADDETPVLNAGFLMTRDTGTLLWRAPEIFALESYGTSADVYR